jgi:enolase
VANAVLVKPNQNGTLTGGLDVVTQAELAHYAAVVSARSGETEDTWLADVAVGSRAGQIKVGSTMRSERAAKWNRLLQIEHELGSVAHGKYAGRHALVPGRTRSPRIDP